MPHSFVADEAGGLRNGISRVFGHNIAISSDNFHFKQNALQLVSDAVGSSNDYVKFLKFMVELQIAATPTIYNSVLKSFKSWIEKSDSRNKKLMAYIDWWDTRRANWSVAFKNNAAEGHSKSQAGNAMMARKDIAN